MLKDALMRGVVYGADCESTVGEPDSIVMKPPDDHYLRLSHFILQ